MIYTVYLDMLFLVNFIMDAAVLMLVKKLLGYSSTYRRILLASLTGALWVCLIVVYPLKPALLEDFVTYVVVSCLMVALSFRPKTMGKLAKGVAALYMVTFTMGGLFYAVYAHTRLGYYISMLAQGNLREAMPLSIAACLTAAAYCFFRFFWEKLMETKRIEDSIFEVCLFYRDGSVMLTGLADTGNGLLDPVSKRPVSVVAYEACKELLKTVDNISYVPFQAVGTEDGILPAVVIDRMQLRQGEKIVIVEKPMIAVYRHTLSANGRYQMLIHPAALENTE